MSESTLPPPAPSGQLALRPAWLLLAGSPRAVRAFAGDVGRTWLFLLLIAAAWGVALACIWSLSSIWFSWYSGLPLMPAAAVLTAIALGPAHRGLTPLTRLAGRDSRGTLAALYLAVLALGLVGLAPPSQDWSSWMPAHLRWLRPEAEYRVLMLMPVWGLWAMVVPVHFCRLSPRVEPLVASFARRQPVFATAVLMAIPLAITLWYFNFLGGWAALPAALALAMGSGGSIALCRLAGGVCRDSLLSANLACQMAFLLGYLAAKAP